MQVSVKSSVSEPSRAEPLCPVFGSCGGCLYQDLTYEEELRRKHAWLTGLFEAALGPQGGRIADVVPSPEPYHYRNRLDLSLRRTAVDGLRMGFQVAGTRHLIEVDACAIAKPEISAFLKIAKEEVLKRLPDDYRTANLVIRTGDDRRMLWGGIGRRSLELKPEDYLWTEIHGRRIYYSMDTFFQANPSILPALMDRVADLAGFDDQTIFYDLYAGVGLFGIYFSDRVKKTYLIEESTASLKVAAHNIQYHGLEQAEIRTGKVEEHLAPLLDASSGRQIALVDPPRRGLTAQARDTLCKARQLEKLLYLSCSPETLVRDLTVFRKAGWTLEKVIPFDFFPKTKHLETLVWLKP